MNDYEVLGYRISKKERKVACCEMVSGDRFMVRQIKREKLDVLVKLADGTIAKPDAIRFMQIFLDAKEIQKFLLKQ